MSTSTTKRSQTDSGQGRAPWGLTGVPSKGGGSPYRPQRSSVCLRQCRHQPNYSRSRRGRNRNRAPVKRNNRVPIPHLGPPVRGDRPTPAAQPRRQPHRGSRPRERCCRSPGPEANCSCRPCRHETAADSPVEPRRRWQPRSHRRRAPPESTAAADRTPAHATAADRSALRESIARQQRQQPQRCSANKTKLFHRFHGRLLGAVIAACVLARRI